MEIYRNAPAATVTLELPTNINATGTVDIFAIENGKVVYEFPTVTRTAAGYTVELPWTLTRQDRDFIIDWNFEYVENTIPYVFKDQTYVQVVTPILSLEETAAIAKYDLSDPQGALDTADLERRVRYAIQTYTGQNFGKFSGTITVQGNGASKLSLPAPILEFGGVLYDGILRPNYGVKIINNGWAISSGQVWIDNIKQAPPEWMLDRFDYQGKIAAPMLYGHNRFYDGVEYTISGVFGYADVPGDVRQAARLLTQDYSCDESLWRERYIDSVRAGDWRFEFNSQAFVGTGNAQADQILSGYRNATMAVV